MTTLKKRFHDEGHSEPITNFHVIEQSTALQQVNDWLLESLQKYSVHTDPIEHETIVKLLGGLK